MSTKAVRVGIQQDRDNRLGFGILTTEAAIGAVAIGHADFTIDAIAFICIIAVLGLLARFEKLAMVTASLAGAVWTWGAYTMTDNIGVLIVTFIFGLGLNLWGLRAANDYSNSAW